MHVLFITSTFPRSPADNQVPWLAELVLRLKKEGIQTTVYAPAYKGSPSHNYYGIPVIRFRYAPARFEILTHEEGAVFKLRQNPWLFLIAPLYLFWGVIGIIRLQRKISPTIIHVHWPFPNGLFGIVAKKLFHAKLILSFHGAEFTLIRRVPMGKTILQWILRTSDKTLANSSFTMGMIQAVLPLHVMIIPSASAISTPTRHPIPMSHKKQLKALFVGRFIERKGIPYLIQAIHTLRRKNIPVSLTIVGNGPLGGLIRKQTESLGLSKAISIRENVNANQLAQYYRESDVFILPSIVDRWHDTEGLGVVLIEAMNFGKPVVATNVGGIPSIIKNNVTGLLVQEKSTKFLADSLEQLYYDPALRNRLAMNGYQFVRRYFNWKTIIRDTLQLYRQIG